MIYSIYMSKLHKFKEFLLDLLYPKHLACIFCDDELDDRSSNDTCYECIHNLPFIDRACTRCGARINDNNDGICLNCKSNNFDYDLSRSVFVYEDKVMSAVHKYKYGGEKYLLEPFGNYLSKYLATWNIYPDYITAVPLHPNREKERGYNQAKCMAEVVATNFGIPYIDACVKVKDNPRQATLPLKERRENVKDAYKIAPDMRKSLKNKTILLIDDVYTTGSTASEIAKVLKSAGVKSVYVLTLAHAVDNREV